MSPDTQPLLRCPWGHTAWYDEHECTITGAGPQCILAVGHEARHMPDWRCGTCEPKNQRPVIRDSARARELDALCWPTDSP